MKTAGCRRGTCRAPRCAIQTGSRPQPQLDAAASHVSAFAEMMTGLHGDRLDTWTAAVEADDLPHLHTFTTGLRRDHAAVLNGLSMTHNSGMAKKP